MTELARNTLKNTIFNGLRALIGGIGGVLFSIVLARILTPKEFGIYVLSISICFFIMQIDFGTCYSAIRYLAYAVGKKNKVLARSYFRFFLKLRLFIGLFQSLLLFVLAKFLAFCIFGKPDIYIPLKILSVFLFFYFLTDFVNCCFQAFHNFRYTVIRRLVYEILKFIFAISFAIIFFDGVFVGLTIASLVTFIVMAYFFYVKYNFLFRKPIIYINKRKILRFMCLVSVGSFSNVVFSYIDVMIVGAILPIYYLGYYKAAANIVFGIVGLTNIARVLLPIFTQLEGNALKEAFKKIFKYSLILSFPFSVSLAYYSPQIIEVVYGVRYLPASKLLRVMSLIVVFSSLNFFGVLFGAKEKPEYSSIISIVLALISVILNYVLILKYQVLGAAIAVTISKLIDLIMRCVIAMRVFNINIDFDAVYKPSISAFLMYLFYYLVPHLNSVIFEAVKLVSGFFVYFILLLVVGGIYMDDIYYLKKLISGR